nr:unnamed protein product [Callosobruchus analis]
MTSSYFLIFSSTVPPDLSMSLTTSVYLVMKVIISVINAKYCSLSRSSCFSLAIWSSIDLISSSSRLRTVCSSAGFAPVTPPSLALSAFRSLRILSVYSLTQVIKPVVDHLDLLPVLVNDLHVGLLLSHYGGQVVFEVVEHLFQFGVFVTCCDQIGDELVSTLTHGGQEIVHVVQLLSSCVRTTFSVSLNQDSNLFLESLNSSHLARPAFSWAWIDRRHEGDLLILYQYGQLLKPIRYSFVFVFVISPVRQHCFQLFSLLLKVFEQPVKRLSERPYVISDYFLALGTGIRNHHLGSVFQILQKHFPLGLLVQQMIQRSSQHFNGELIAKRSLVDLMSISAATNFSWSNFRLVTSFFIDSCALPGRTDIFLSTYSSSSCNLMLLSGKRSWISIHIQRFILSLIDQLLSLITNGFDELLMSHNFLVHDLVFREGVPNGPHVPQLLPDHLATIWRRMGVKLLTFFYEIFELHRFLVPFFHQVFDFLLSVLQDAQIANNVTQVLEFFFFVREPV